MALPIRTYVASQAVQLAMEKARTLRGNVQTWKARIDTGTTGDIIINAALGIKQQRDFLASLASVSGLNDAAKEEYDDPNLDFAAEIAAVVTACDNCLAWINANYPKDASGYLLDTKIVNGALEKRAFTGAALSGLSTQLATLLAAFS